MQNVFLTWIATKQTTYLKSVYVAPPPKSIQLESLTQMQTMFVKRRPLGYFNLQLVITFTHNVTRQFLDDQISRNAIGQQFIQFWTYRQQWFRTLLCTWKEKKPANTTKTRNESDARTQPNQPPPPPPRQQHTDVVRNGTNESFPVCHIDHLIRCHGVLLYFAGFQHQDSTTQITFGHGSNTDRQLVWQLHSFTFADFLQHGNNLILLGCRPCCSKSKKGFRLVTIRILSMRMQLISWPNEMVSLWDAFQPRFANWFRSIRKLGPGTSECLNMVECV